MQYMVADWLVVSPTRRLALSVGTSGEEAGLFATY